MLYDAAIIGAGADGLAAAAHLARAGATVVVIERAERCGGRLQTREFRPGFFASPFADQVAEIAPAILQTLGDVPLRPGPPVAEGIRLRHRRAVDHLLDLAATPHRDNFLARLQRRGAPPAAPWPGTDLATDRLAAWDGVAAMPGRALDAQLAGSALALLTLPRVEPVTGGLAVLGKAFAAAAGGAEIRLGLEASEILTERGRVTGVLLADGSRIAAKAVISTLDFKQSVLGLFPWNVPPPVLMAAAASFRLAGATARLLLAFNQVLGAETALTLAGDGQALAAFRRGVLPDHPPLRFDPVSARDPTLAPRGCATATLTLGCVPGRLLDGNWTHARRVSMAAKALALLSRHRPGLIDHLTAVEIIVPPDIDAALGATGGDLDGGQLAPDQMLGLRPGIRTQLAGFYLGGASTGAGPLGTGLAGLAAAIAVIADTTPAGLARWLP